MFVGPCLDVEMEVYEALCDEELGGGVSTIERQCPHGVKPATLYVEPA